MGCRKSQRGHLVQDGFRGEKADISLEEAIMDHQEFAQLLGNYGEFVGAIGVVVTLDYLAVQIRLNTRQVRGEAILSVNEAMGNTHRALREDADLLSACIRANADWHSVGPREQARVHLHNIEQVSYCESAFTLWVQGALDETTYLSRENLILSVLACPGATFWWREWKRIFTPSFQERIDLRLSDPKAQYEPLTERVSFYDSVHWQPDTKEENTEHSA